MKKLLTIALVLILLALIVPAALNFYASGPLGDRNVLAEATGHGFQIVEASVDRGIFSSDQTLTLRPNDVPENAWINDLLGRAPGNDGADLVIRNTIRPGPIPIGPFSEGALRPAYANAVSTFATRDPAGSERAFPGVLYSRITPIGSHHRYVLDQGEFELAGSRESVTLDGRGVDLRLHRGGTLGIDGEVDALRLTSGDGTLTIDGLDVDATNELDEGIAEFEARVTARELDATTANDEGIGSVRDLDVLTEMAVEGDDGYLVLKASGDALAEGRKANFDVDLRYDTSADALRSLTTIAHLMAAADQTGRGPPLDLVLAEVGAILGAGGKLAIDKLYVDTDDGPISVNADLALAPGATTPIGALTETEGSGSIELPVKFIDALRRDPNGPGRNLNIALQMRLLKRDGATYRTEFEIGNGILNVNSIPLPIPLLGR